ncbi:peptidase U32 family protein [Gelidibacter salicanalis]|uniref:U32 family peptidase n=1 Tax=Gelidibacter salicanalis TaxID=291193 RepID=A0A934KQX2_9FLAO|nr:peptidase U32 family protein [Gelidibacter salicanalis]MBJ7880460.1 U32 family peptidase [Gelidibacter salicanalis]
MNYNNIEILAPVGSYESLTTALNAGCNSVYFGVEQLNMRSRSSTNFTLDDLRVISRTCNDRNIKTYLTINTILYDHDIGLMKTIVNQAKDSGITAIIASDHAVMSYCKSIAMPLHISTQANVTNIETVEFYAAFANVMVLSRELSLRQVAEISRAIERKQIKGPSGELVKLEIFAHGALCMAISGKCYLSLHSNNASANRGACIQNCRKQYIVTDKEDGVELEIDNEYIMSAKDLCTIGFLDKILKSGVNILKIEGRGRSPDYVDTVVRCYKEAVTALQEERYTQERIENWEKQLATVYNRGFWDGYYLGRKMGEWNDSYGSKATEKKIFIARGIKYFDKIEVGEFRVESHSLKKGDKIMVTGPTTGVLKAELGEIRVNDVTVESVSKGDVFSIKMDEIIRPSSKLYKIVSE